MAQTPAERVIEFSEKLNVEGGSGSIDDPRVNLLLARLKLSNDYYAQKRDDFIRYYQGYRAYRREPDYPWTSNMVMPVIFDTVETFLPHVVGDQLELRPEARLGADPKKAEMWKAIFQYDVEAMELVQKQIVMMRQALIYGWSPFLCDWLYDERPMKVHQFRNLNEGTPYEKTIPRVVQIPIVMHDGPQVQVLDIFNVFLQPGKATINGPPAEKSDWLIIRFVLPFKHLKMLADQGIIEKAALKKLMESNLPDVNDDESQQGIEERLSLIGIDSNTFDTTMHQVEILCMFGDRGFSRPEDGIIWLGNRRVILRDETSPLWHGEIPVGIVNDIRMPHEAMGIGEAEIAESFQEEKSDLRNARMDNIHQLVNRMWSVMNNAGIDDVELMSRPGGIVHMDVPGAVQPLINQDVPFSTYREEELLDQDVQRVTGALDVLRGLAFNASRPTATSDKIKAEFAAARTRMKILDMQNHFLRQVGRWIIALEQQFTTEDKQIRINRNGITEDIRVSPEDISGDWDVHPELDQALPLSKEQRRQDAAMALQTLGPYVQGGVVVADEIIKHFLKVYNIPNPEKMLTSMQQRMEQVQDPRAMVQAAMQQAGGGPVQ
tara:strand:+ start:925 stop:2739 length:1815 start_codon:yes stop_codon:yes gene_type:complete